MTFKKVYVCSPLSAPTAFAIKQNMLTAKEYMKIISKKLSCSAVAPHAYLPEFLDDNNPPERSLGLSFGLAYLELCDALVICGNRLSNGMKAEIKRAMERSIPVLLYPYDPSDEQPVFGGMKIVQGDDFLDLYLRKNYF